jgi:hypothetical protein
MSSTISPCEQAVRDAAARMRRVVTRGDLVNLLDLAEELRKAVVGAVIYNEASSDRTIGMTPGDRRRQARACLAQAFDYLGCLDEEISALLRKAGAAEQSP